MEVYLDNQYESTSDGVTLGETVSNEKLILLQKSFDTPVSQAHLKVRSYLVY